MLTYAGSVTFYRDLDLDEYAIPGLSKLATLFIKCLSHTIFIVLTVMVWIRPLAWMIDRCSAMILVGLLDPQSRGRVWVERKKTCKGREASCRMSEANVLIDPAYLDDDRDLEQVEYGWRALDGIAPRLFPGALEILPGVLFPDRNKYAADFSLPYYHWSGSCSMEAVNGSSDQAESRYEYVVDKNLQVCNIKGLHVCDASVLPMNVSCNPSLLLAAVGFTAASSIKLDVSDTYEDIGRNVFIADNLEEKKRK